MSCLLQLVTFLATKASKRLTQLDSTSSPTKAEALFIPQPTRMVVLQTMRQTITRWVHGSVNPVAMPAWNSSLHTLVSTV
ncbi:MAG: hypothetical protein CBC33_008925 [Coraliomargarita sp. TMED73]|nr:MAG: hypothetical protein CBC33_008925 [Coraliomargarita sp. TMED73]